jgi:tetratricopeptide (TPR) repeat protein
MIAFYLLATGGTLPAARAAAQTAALVNPLAQADELYTHREDIANARQAVTLYDQLAATSFEAAWKLARAYYWLATAGPAKERGAARDRGVKAGELAVKLDPTRPEGHFWLAAILGEVAENASFLTAWKYPGRIKDGLERVLQMDPAWQDGSADRALGEWYFKVPGISGGDHKKAEEHLRASLKYNPRSIASLFFLGEVIADDSKRKEEATAVLKQALEAPVDADWGPEDRQFQAKATALLAKLSRK